LTSHHITEIREHLVWVCVPNIMELVIFCWSFLSAMEYFFNSSECWKYTIIQINTNIDNKDQCPTILLCFYLPCIISNFLLSSVILNQLSKKKMLKSWIWSENKCKINLLFCIKLYGYSQPKFFNFQNYFLHYTYRYKHVYLLMVSLQQLRSRLVNAL
jgi:hypothetical protein